MITVQVSVVLVEEHPTKTTMVSNYSLYHTYVYREVIFYFIDYTYLHTI